MARLIKSPLGEISGKAGGLVFKKTKYGIYLSSLPNFSHKKVSQLQQLQQNKMKVVMHFLKPLQNILSKTYFPLRQNSLAFHQIKSYYLRHALKPMEKAYAIDYAKCLMSYGELRPPEQVTAQRPVTDTIVLTWEPQLGQALAQSNDPLFAVLYHEAAHLFYFIPKVAGRVDGTGTLKLHQKWANFSNLHLWVGYARTEEKRASVSVYVGEV
ncbi:DUF6266 family protein [Mesonia sp. K7]|uniref:DUF6266 family protein n=1 Tax=Mesonia sp. K7 TaxID=2218606 RepID=UPI0011B56E45|nr:DUF6266 family protein [Mesonia sp. K7]